VCDAELLGRGLQALGLEISATSREKILVYCRELLKWNRRINLIARNTPPDEALEKHFLDSLTLLPILEQYGESDSTLLDVGTGAGFPGLVLAAVRPGLRVTLVEVRQKRVTFLRHIIRTLDLANITVVATRLEQASLEGHRFDFITGRAVADAKRFLELLADIPDPDTLVVLMQAAEDQNGRRGPSGTGKWRLIRDEKFYLPFSGGRRRLSVLRRSAG
jgi:16S rRNA (guanine527-N7)-methyltransferase